MPPHNDDVILVRLEYIASAVDEIKGDVKAQNGRIAAAETAIAVLEDRADAAKSSGRTWGLTAGGVGTALAAALAYLFGGK